MRTRAFNGTFGRSVIKGVMVAVKLNRHSGPGRKRGSPAVVTDFGLAAYAAKLAQAAYAAPQNDMG